MNAFEEYLALHEIDPVTLSIQAHVRYLTVWNAKKGNPITAESAQKIKQALLKLTGVPYTGSFVLFKQQSIDEIPTLPIKKIPRSHCTSYQGIEMSIRGQDGKRYNRKLTRM